MRYLTKEDIKGQRISTTNQMMEAIKLKLLLLMKT